MPTTLQLESFVLQTLARLGLNHWALTVTNTPPALVRGTGSAAKVKVTNAIDYFRLGIQRTPIAATTEVALSGSKVADLHRCKFLISINASDALAATQGPIALTTAAMPDLPALPSGHVCVGYLLVTNASGADFIPGTTLLSAITDTYQDLLWPDSGPSAFSQEAV